MSARTLHGRVAWWELGLQLFLEMCQDGRREEEKASTCSDLPVQPLTKPLWKPASKGFLEMQAAGVIFLGQRGQSRALVVGGGQGHKWRRTGTSGVGLVNYRVGRLLATALTA